MSEPHAGLVTALAKLLKTGEFSDLKILCGDSEFAVHKNIICCQESQESVIDLTIDTEPCVSCLVNFLYRCDYDALGSDSGGISTDGLEPNNDTNDDNVGPRNLIDIAIMDENIPVDEHRLALHLDMYILANKYDIASLGELAKKKFEGVAEQSRPSFVSWPDLVYPVLEMIPRIYAATGRHNGGLRDVVVEYVRHRRIQADSNTWDFPPYNESGKSFTNQVEALFESVPEFALDVSRSWLKMPYLGCARNGNR